MKLTGHPATNLAERPPPPSNVYLNMDALIDAQNATEQLIRQMEERLFTVLSAPNEKKDTDLPSPGISCALSEAISTRASHQRMFNNMLTAILDRLAI
jgi:hypothetical protein